MCIRDSLKVVQYVGFDTGKTGFCRRKVIRYNHAGYQNRINADTYHYEEALKTEGKLIICILLITIILVVTTDVGIVLYNCEARAS